MAGKTLFLLDAYALIYRAYYGMLRSPRITSKGLNTSAVFGFSNTLEEVLHKQQPDYIAVCFDPPHGRTFRHEAYEQYKAQREKQPEDITLALPYIKRLLDAYRIPMVEVAGFEADDVIGTLATKASAEGFTTYMMTLDKDYGQLVSENVLMYRPSLGGQGFEIRDVKAVTEKYGIERPEQVIDLLALEGDASDNIPGCPGVGEKTAAKLVAEFGSIENLLANTDQLKGALQRKITENVDKIKFSKFLVTIRRDVPVEVDLEDFKRQEPDMQALVALYGELEFRSKLAAMNVAAPNAAPQPTQLSLFDDSIDSVEAADTTLADLHATITCVNTPEEIDDFASRLTKWVGVAISAPEEDAMTTPLLSLALASENEAIVVDIPEFEATSEPIFAAIGRVLLNPAIIPVSHDVKRLMTILRRFGVNLHERNDYRDTSLAHYLLSSESKHELQAVALAELRHRTIDSDIPERERRRAIPSAEVLGERALITFKLNKHFTRRIEQEGLTHLYYDIELPFAAVLAAMEWEGVRIDIATLQAISDKLTARLTTLEQQAYELAGGPFNLNSPAQVGEVLFGRLQIDPKARRNRTGSWQTGEDVLEKYAATQPIVRLILDIRGLRKLLATYVNALPKLVNQATGKIHTTFNQTATATGRISSANPNLQNIPVRTEDGREIRRAFIADPGCVVLSADYSQIELRLMAELSGDPVMVEAFAHGEDIHRSTAAKIFHEDIDNVTVDQRRIAKTANFGIIYGISAFGLAERLGIPRAEARTLIDNYMSTYAGVQQYIHSQVESAQAKGYVQTLFGRKRFLPDINSRNATVRGFAERNAVNAPLQGSAADIIKIAMVNIYREMRARHMRSQMVIQVHDELVFNVYPDELDQLKSIVRTHMEGAYQGRVPLEVSIDTAHNWLEAH